MTSDLRKVEWPWGSNNPTLSKRIVVATLVAVVSTLLLAIQYSHSGAHSDIGQVWFAANELRALRNPYPQIGPGREFNFDWVTNYPATAFALFLPLSWLTERAASLMFVFCSVWLVLFGATRDSWHRLPAFASTAFIVAVKASQWSPLLSAGWFVAPAAIAWAAKPTIGLAMFIAAPTRRHRMIALFGGIILLGVSMIAVPDWPIYWWRAIQNSSQMVSPLLHPAGFLLVLTLLRARRRESVFLFAMACVPQAPSIYDAFPILLLVPNTYRESAFLSVVSSAGGLMMLLAPQDTAAEFIRWRGALLVATTYLPAMVIILRRPNSGAQEINAGE